MTNSINSQCRRKFLSKSGTCFKVVCVEMPICPRPRCASVSAGIRNECSGLAALSLTDSERAACPQYQNKSSISCFVNLRCCLPCGGDCQVTFRKLSLYLSVCHAKPSPPPPPNPHLPPMPPSLPSPLSTAAEKQVHCDSECSSTAQWLLFEMRFERVSMREKDREPRAD